MFSFYHRLGGWLDDSHVSCEPTVLPTQQTTLKQASENNWAPFKTLELHYDEHYSEINDKMLLNSSQVLTKTEDLFFCRS